LSRPSTLLFVPCFNEERRIGGVLRRVAEVGGAIDECLVVDDGSTDGSLDEVRASPVSCTVLRHGERRGLGEAFRTAYRHALEADHEVFCVLAGNGKDDPLELPRVAGPVQGDEADFVQGSRFHPRGGRSERLPGHRDLAIRLFSLVASVVCRRRLTDASNGFRAYRTTLLRDPRIDWCAPWLGSSYQVEIHLLVRACKLGYRVIEVPTTKIYPADGRPYSKAVLMDWFRLCKPLLYGGLGLDHPSRTR